MLRPTGINCINSYDKQTAATLDTSKPLPNTYSWKETAPKNAQLLAVKGFSKLIVAIRSIANDLQARGAVSGSTRVPRSPQHGEMAFAGPPLPVRDNRPALTDTDLRYWLPEHVHCSTPHVRVVLGAKPRAEQRSVCVCVGGGG